MGRLLSTIVIYLITRKLMSIIGYILVVCYYARNNLSNRKSDNMRIWTVMLISIIAAAGFVISNSLTEKNFGDHSANAAAGNPKTFLKIQDLKINKGPTGSIDVTGKVVNNSTKDVEDIKLTVSYYDDTNNLLTKSIKFLSNPSEKVRPNGVKDFNFVETVTFSRIAHSNANATANAAK